MNSKDIARGGPLPQPQPEQPQPSPLKKFVKNTLIGLSVWAVIGMVRGCSGITGLAFKDRDKT